MTIKDVLLALAMAVVFWGCIWLEENGISFKDEHMQFELINRTSQAFLLNQNDKVVDYAINVQLKYFYKK